MKLIYSERGGARYKVSGLWWHVTWPLAKFELFDDKIVLITAFFEKQIFLKDIISVRHRCYIPFFADGLYINYNNFEKKPETITFWSVRNAQYLFQLVEKTRAVVAGTSGKSNPQN